MPDIRGACWIGSAPTIPTTSLTLSFGATACPTAAISFASSHPTLFSASYLATAGPTFVTAERVAMASTATRPTPSPANSIAQRAPVTCSLVGRAGAVRRPDRAPPLAAS